MQRKIIALLLAAIAFCSLFVLTASCAETADEATAVSGTQTADNAVIESAADEAAESVTSKEQPIGLVIGMGLGVVFFGLICIVLLSTVMSAIIRAAEKKLKKDEASAPAVTAAAVAADDLSPEKRREVIAAVSAVIAEELGTDVSAIRVTSFRRV